MKNIKLLVVKWNEHESASYYIDKDKYSRVHKVRGGYNLDSFGGTYHFSTNDWQVTFDNGVYSYRATVKEWYVTEE